MDFCVCGNNLFKIKNSYICFSEIDAIVIYQSSKSVIILENTHKIEKFYLSREAVNEVILYFSKLLCCSEFNYYLSIV